MTVLASDCERPALRVERPAPTGAVFFHRGRPLKIVKAHGTDEAAPVILEELHAIGLGLAGQYSLWALSAVREAMRA